MSIADLDLGDRNVGLPSKIGQFSIKGRLGRGGMGVVLDAEDSRGRPIALKLIRPQGDPERQRTLVARLLREAKILGQLEHPGIVRLVESGEVEGVAYLAMEVVEGVTLHAIRKKIALDRAALISLATQLSHALAHLHEAGVIHRDIKPGNVIIRPGGQAVLADFGIARHSEATGITRAGEVVGSAGYLAPECFLGQSPTELSDQYALGILLFETGAHTRRARIPKHVPVLDRFMKLREIDWSRFPEQSSLQDVRRLLKRMLEPDPEHRFPDARSCFRAWAELEPTSPGLRALTEVADQADETPISHTLHLMLEQLRLPPGNLFEADAEPVDEERDLLSVVELPSHEDIAASPWDLGARGTGNELEATEADGESGELADALAGRSAPSERTASDMGETRVEVSPRHQQSPMRFDTDTPVEGSASPAALVPRSASDGYEPTIIVPDHRNATRADRPPRPDEVDVIERFETGAPDFDGRATAPDLNAEVPPSFDHQPTVSGESGPSAAPVPHSTDMETEMELVDPNLMSEFENAFEVASKSSERALGRRDIEASMELVKPAISGVQKVGASGIIERQREPKKRPTSSPPPIVKPLHSEAPPAPSIAPEPRPGVAVPVAPARWRLPLVAGSLVIGVLLGFLVAATLGLGKSHRLERTPLLGLPVDVVEVEGVAPVFEYAEPQPPTDEKRKLAQRMYEQALGSMADRNFENASRYLGMCIRLGDLADCHLTLGTLLSLTRNPAARLHLARFVELAPKGDPAGARIRAMLDR